MTTSPTVRLSSSAGVDPNRVIKSHRDEETGHYFFTIDQDEAREAVAECVDQDHNNEDTERNGMRLVTDADMACEAHRKALEAARTQIRSDRARYRASLEEIKSMVSSHKQNILRMQGEITEATSRYKKSLSPGGLPGTTAADHKAFHEALKLAALRDKKKSPDDLPKEDEEEPSLPDPRPYYAFLAMAGLVGGFPFGVMLALLAGIEIDDFYPPSPLALLFWLSGTCLVATLMWAIGWQRRREEYARLLSEDDNPQYKKEVVLYARDKYFRVGIYFSLFALMVLDGFGAYTGAQLVNEARTDGGSDPIAYLEYFSLLIVFLLNFLLAMAERAIASHQGLVDYFYRQKWEDWHDRDRFERWALEYRDKRPVLRSAQEDLDLITRNKQEIGERQVQLQGAEKLLDEYGGPPPPSRGILIDHLEEMKDQVERALNR